MAFGSILLMRCAAPEYTLIVDNQSSLEITFTMTIGYSTETRTLTAGNKYIHPNAIPVALRNKERMGSYEPKELVCFSYSDDIYTFYDIPLSERQGYIVKVKNLTGEKVTLTAGVWMEDINLTDVSTEQSDPAWLVYTDEPDFTVTTESGFPVEINYTFIDNIFMVVIKW